MQQQAERVIAQLHPALQEDAGASEITGAGMPCSNGPLLGHYSLSFLVLLRLLVGVLLRSGRQAGKRYEGVRLGGAHQVRAAFEVTYILPAEHLVAARAVDVCHDVEACHQYSLLLGPKGNVHAAGTKGVVNPKGDEGSLERAQPSTYALLKRKALPCFPWNDCADRHTCRMRTA